MEVTNKAFKAYDVRGVYPTEVNEEMAYRVGRIFSAMFAAETVVVGHDIRLSGPAIVAALTEGLRHGGTIRIHGKQFPANRVDPFVCALCRQTAHDQQPPRIFSSPMQGTFRRRISLLQKVQHGLHICVRTFICTFFHVSSRRLYDFLHFITALIGMQEKVAQQKLSDLMRKKDTIYSLQQRRNVVQ